MANKLWAKPELTVQLSDRERIIGALMRETRFEATPEETKAFKRILEAFEQTHRQLLDLTAPGATYRLLEERHAKIREHARDGKDVKDLPHPDLHHCSVELEEKRSSLGAALKHHSLEARGVCAPIISRFLEGATPYVTELVAAVEAQQKALNETLGIPELDAPRPWILEMTLSVVKFLEQEATPPPPGFRGDHANPRGLIHGLVDLS
jgi:hypothetical protein